MTLPTSPSSSSTSHHSHAFATRTIHVGSSPADSATGGVSTPLDLSTTYAQRGVGNLVSGFEYSRSSNPTRLALEKVLASLEGADVGLAKELERQGGEGQSVEQWTKENGPPALAFASGSAATATVLQALAGGNGTGHIVSVGDVYGGTSRYMLKVAGPLQGAETTFVDLSYRGEDGDEEIVERLERALKPETKVIWVESPTNPMLNLIPLALVATVAKKHGIPLIVDNTFASPYLQLPLSLGATAVVGSSTKYLSGHSDLIGGYIASSSPTLLSKLRFLQNAHGAVPSPFDAYLLIRSLKTLVLRVRQHSLNGLAVARFLEEEGVPSGLVRDVRYPGLKRGNETTSQRRERALAWAQLAPEAKKWVEKQGYSVESEGGFPAGGMVTFHIKSPAAESQTETAVAERFLEEVKVFTLAESLGGVESLAELPLRMTHGGVDPAQRALLGIDGELIRLSVGVEDVDDLLEDIKQALEKAVGVGAKASNGVKTNGAKANGVKTNGAKTNGVVAEVSGNADEPKGWAE